MPSRRPSTNEPSPLAAICLLFLAGCAAVMFLGGINSLFGSDHEPQPAPTVTVTETTVEEPSVSPIAIPSEVIDGWLRKNIPDACTEAGARGEVPRDRWTPCGQLLGYFDDSTTPPAGAPVVP